MLNELTKILLENEDNNFAYPYDKQEDQSVPHIGEKRKKVIHLRDLNRLKKIRNQKREELAQDSVFQPILYGPDMSQQEGGDMDGGMPM